jgi:hypothetical protein
MEKQQQVDDLALARKRRLKKLVYANLVGASLLSAVGFSASAHGNASSHTRDNHSLSWDLDDFVIDQKEQPTVGRQKDAEQRTNGDTPTH